MTPFDNVDLTGYAEGYDAHARYYESGDCHLFFECRWKNTGAPWVAPAADIAIATAEWLNGNQRVTVISDYIDVRNETANWADLPIFGYTGVYTCSGSISAPAGLNGNVMAPNGRKPLERRKAPILAAIPIQIVDTSLLIKFIVS